MLSINMSDVMNVVNTIKPYLIAIIIILIVGIVVKIAVMKLNQPLKRRIRASSTVGILAGVCICVNLICTGPMSTMLDLVSGSGTISEETTEAAKETALQIGDEGIVMMENDENILPLGDGAKLNVFGWASINPILGGAGSGSLNDSYDRVKGFTQCGSCLWHIATSMDNGSAISRIVFWCLTYSLLFSYYAYIYAYKIRFTCKIIYFR